MSEESAEAGRALVASGRLPPLDETLQFLYPESDDDPVLQHGDSWLRDPKLQVAVTALGDRIALARGTRLLLVRLTDTRGVGTVPTPLALLHTPAPESEERRELTQRLAWATQWTDGTC
jgi:hypothetical protein